MEPSVCIILVNYRTWQDTVECVESILKSSYKNYQIVIVENGSGDESWENMLRWAKGELTHGILPTNKLFRLSHPPHHKPLLYFRATPYEAQHMSRGPQQDINPLLFIRSDKNLGFAGGNNIGLGYALHARFDYAWLLNNDTVIEHDAISELVKYCEEEKKKNSKTGIAGSKLLVYHKPDTLQGIGAVFNKFSGKSKIIGAQEKDTGQYDHNGFEMNYVIGAAMFVSREFLLDVGMMSEEYFLYNEENDWAARGRQKGWKVGVAVKSKVYHKQGTSTGNSPKKSRWHVTAMQYKYRGKIRLYKKYYRRQLPFLYFHLITRSLRSVMRGNFDETRVIYASIFNTKFERKG